jgi:hypothetical protein
VRAGLASVFPSPDGNEPPFRDGHAGEHGHRLAYKHGDVDLDSNGDGDADRYPNRSADRDSH